jgi:hypothetical protein
VIQLLKNSKMGVNLEPIVCPSCGTVANPVKPRFPRSLRQFLWGGFTCENCGCDVDKWGHERKKKT